MTITEHRRKYLREYQRKWKEKNRELIRQKEKKRYHSQTKEHKAMVVLRNKLRRHRLRLEAIKHYGNKCACCGETQIDFLCIDHINGDGSAHRKIMTTRSIGEWLYSNNYPKGFQVLCHNCNIGKGINGKCPHQK